MAKTSRASGGEGWSFSSACPACGKDPAACRCAVRTQKVEKPTVRLRMEKRRGKPVTVLATAGIGSGELDALLRELKTACGTGGTRKQDELELQGEHREKVRDLLAGRGYVVKGA